MRIIFVRHGEPDYEHDCLTETGRRQAAAAAERLDGEGIQAVYASPNGRAQETAGYTARRIGLPVQTLDFMHEITWGGPGVPEEGHPWTLGDRMIAEEDFDYFTRSWREHPFFAANDATVCYDRVTAAFDAFLAGQGYVHEGHRFLCRGGSPDTIAVFSHGGSGACVLAHLLGLPFPYVASVLPYDFTSVIILDFADQPGAYVFPRLALFNDIAHIDKKTGGPKLQQRPDGMDTAQ